MSIIQFKTGNKDAKLPERIEKEPLRNAVLPRLDSEIGSFLGWCIPEVQDQVFMNFSSEEDVTLQAAITEKPAYIIESHYRGDVNDYVGKRCHYRRYVVDIYLENAIAREGQFKIDVCNDFLYYLGNVPVGDIITKIDAPTKKNYGRSKYLEADDFQTDYITVYWKNKEPVNAMQQRKKIARVMLYFSRWGLGYSEIAARPSDEVIRPDWNFETLAEKEKAYVSANFYIGVKDYETSSAEDFEKYEDSKNDHTTEESEVISRFAVMTDTHVGARYNWENYDWLYSAFQGIKRAHEEKKLDFVVQMGDNIDDGYAASYEADYKEYLEVIKNFEICDPVNPVENRRAGMIPHYEMQGNHDTSMDTRFFRNKMWHTETAAGEKVFYIAFFVEYGGYPLIDYEIAHNYDSYRSYGVVPDQAITFIEACVEKAKKENASQIVLMSHFGIAKELTGQMLPESGLGKIVRICKKNNIKLFFNGHEHNKNYSLYNFDGIYDYDAAMTVDRYAIVEIKKKSADVMIYNSKDNTVYRVDHIEL